MPRCSKCSLRLRFPHQNPACPLLSLVRSIWPDRVILLDLITRRVFGEKHRHNVIQRLINTDQYYNELRKTYIDIMRLDTYAQLYHHCVGDKLYQAGTKNGTLQYN
jgi:hypothetical protein